ncbi:MAG: OadG family protein [Tannerellaceae bacterium]
MTNLETGLTLMIVGMTTVFTILLFVILVGKTLISYTNKFAPLPPPPKLKSTDNKTSLSHHSPTTKQIAAITAAVQIVTKGKGSISHIEKV